jgi:hypothetical protein
MTTHYLPNADEPALQPFTRAFVDMMFAHAAFEHRVSDLMEVVTGVKGFGERPENQWLMDDRPKRMKRLIKEYRRDVVLIFWFACTSEFMVMVNYWRRLARSTGALSTSTHPFRQCRRAPTRHLCVPKIQTRT